MRTIVDLPEEQIEALKQMSDQFHLSRAELMRRAIAEFLVRHQAEPSNEAFGIWKKNKRDSLKHQETMRGEWDQYS